MFECYEGTYTKKYHEHVPCSYAYKVVCIDDKYNKSIVVYRGKNAAYEFIKSILQKHKYCKKIMKDQFNKNLVMTEKGEYLFQQSNNCRICKKLIDNEDEKVRDHCHITGKFRGVARWDCNINFKLTKYISVICDNLKGYDSHLIFSELHKFNLKFDVIPNGLEKYMAFFLVRDLVFIDSIQFMNSSLDKLVKNLSDEDFKYLVKEFSSENLKILKQKGAYPYEYLNSFKRFNEDKLCARKYFYSSTKDKKISEDGKISDGHVSIEDYMVYERNGDKFKMKNMGDYHDHYLKKDVLLLGDVFEKFIGTCLKYYELNPCNYFSAPGLSWDAVLKMTGVKLEKISDIDQYLFIEKGTRGVVSYITKRYAKGNNKYMSDYDPNKPSTFITYLDKNNLYGWAMSEYLPYGEFEWLKNVDELDVMSINEKIDVGYILKVDLKYPDKFHELHNDYPLAPEKLAVTNDMLSKCCKEIADKYNIKVGDIKKLIPNLGNKTKYVVHYRNLQLYLSLGMKLTKIHKVLKFKQSDWMKKYVDFNTKKRMGDFEKDFLKLMINSVYGKRMENLRKGSM